jgi:kynureninase
MQHQNTLAYAQELDKKDELAAFRQRFHFPQHEGKDVIYFTGNSLGLQPKNTEAYIQQELNDWKTYGVEGHFLAKNPWFSYHEILTEQAAKLVGALPSEVVMMNQLTVNLHLLMVSFYRPTAKRYKILCEAKAFPSDQYALQSQAEFHGFKADNAIIEVEPREGEYSIRYEDILAAIEKHKDELALIMFSGVNYFTGQVFDMKAITELGHKHGIVVGFDLAHAAGNIDLHLHDWGVDFAAWCSYKYLNSGPGSVAGAFVHERHHKNTSLPLFAGWWGTDKKKRFLMEKTFHPIEGAERWQLSNAPVFSMAAHKAALDVITDAGFSKMRKKSADLLTYLEFIITEINEKQAEGKKFEFLTPKENSPYIPKGIQPGCQFSIIAHGRGKELFNALVKHGVVPDWREPNVIRMAPVPLYNSFEDLYRFGEILKGLCS